MTDMIGRLMGPDVSEHETVAPPGEMRCLCVKTHVPVSLLIERHHILPESYGGLTKADNLVWLCPNAHYNVHAMLRYMLANGSLTSMTALRIGLGSSINTYAYGIAADGYRRINALAVTADQMARLESETAR